MKIRVEIADTPYKQSKGLMFRKSLPDDSGMLFKFEKPGNLRFWNANTYIPLDIAFIDKDNKIAEISQLNPVTHSSYLNPQTIVSKSICNKALEVNEGFFNRNKISIGDKLEINDSGEIIFVKSEYKQAQQYVDKQDEIDYDEEQGLPVISMADISEYLEDNFDEDDEYGYEEVPEDFYVSPDHQDTYIHQQEEDIYDEEIEDFFVPEAGEYPEFSSPKDAVEYAKNNLESIRIWYETKKGRDIERSIEPHGEFYADTTNNHIIVAFDNTVGDIRAFIADNILFHNFEGKKFNKKFQFKT